MDKKIYKLRYFVNITEVYPTFLIPLYENEGNIYKSIIDDKKIIDFVRVKLDIYHTIIQVLDNEFAKTKNEEAIYAYAISRKNYFYGDYDDVKKYIVNNGLLKKNISIGKELFQQKKLYYFTGKIREWGNILDKLDASKFLDYSKWIRYERQNVHGKLYEDLYKLRNDDNGYIIADKVLVLGGNPLVGAVEINGSSEVALEILAASILSHETIVLTNVPSTGDVSRFIEIINKMGGEASFINKNKVMINCDKLTCSNFELNGFSNKNIRYYVISALYARFKSQELNQANMQSEINLVVANRENAVHLEEKNQLVQKYILNEQSIRTTIQLLIEATAYSTKTEIINASKDPCVVALAVFLNEIGVYVKGAGTNRITVVGCKKLKGTNYEIIPDYIEAAVFMCATIITKGELEIKKVIPHHLKPLISKCKEMGADIVVKDDSLIVRMDYRPKSIGIFFESYPRLSSAYEPFLLPILGLASGISLIVNKEKFDHSAYIRNLNFEGVKIFQTSATERNELWIEGIDKYSNNEVLYVEDVMNCFVLLLAAISSESQFYIYNCKEINNIFDGFFRKLVSVGAIIVNCNDKKVDRKDYTKELKCS